MRVLSLNTERTWRGGEGQTLALAVGLHRRGHGSMVVAQPGSPLARRARSAGLLLEELTMRGEWDLPAILRLRRILRDWRPHIVHMHTSHAHTLGVAASVMAGVGRRVVSRRVDFSIHRHRLSMSGLKYRYWVDRYIAISTAVKDALVKDGVEAGRISLVHSGVDPERFLDGDAEQARRDLGVPQDAPLVGTLAHFGWHKSLETLIAAAYPLLTKVPSAWVAILGDGDLRPQLVAEREKSPVHERILMPGFRPNVADFLAAFDVFVMPSIMEGLCTSIMDAFCVGVPVVASRAGGIPELVEDEVTGLLSTPGDPDSLADALARMLTTPDLAREVTAAAQQKVLARFTHDAMVEGTLGVYQELLEADDSARPEPS